MFLPEIQMLIIGLYAWPASGLGLHQNIRTLYCAYQPPTGVNRNFRQFLRDFRSRKEKIMSSPEFDGALTFLTIENAPA